MTSQQFPRKFDKYILLDRINAGGMAEVYRAKLTSVEQFQRLLAIKCMLPALALDKGFVTMFVDEAKLASQLSHANVVQIHELGRIGDQLYIAMELINGRDLRHIVRTAKEAGRTIPLPFAAYVVSRAALGLDYAHKKRGLDGNPLNIVHRDVSPQNILVSYDGEVKVADFGIAKAEERATNTQAGILKGKFAYMSPEQIGGEPMDQRTDVFALGTVLFETLVGERLFQGKSDISIMRKVRRAEVPRLADVLPDAPEELQQVLDKALARDPAQRYLYAQHLSEALEPFLIRDRSIFGPNQAAELMRELYAAEIAQLEENTRRYGATTLQDCAEHAPPAEALGAAFADESRASEVFVTDAEAIASDTLLDVTASPTAANDWQGATDVLSAVEREEAGWSSSAARPVATAVSSSQASPSPEPTTAEVPLATSSGPAPFDPRWWVLLAGSFVVVASVGVWQLTQRGERDRPSATVEPIVLEPQATGAATGDADVLAQEERPPASQSDPTPVDTVLPEDPVEGGAEPEPGEADELEDERSPVTRPRFGFLSIRANGVDVAKVYVDNKEVGYSPVVFHRLPHGWHRVRVVEVSGERVGNSRNADVYVGPKHTRRAPYKLVMELQGTLTAP